MKGKGSSDVEDPERIWVVLSIKIDDHVFGNSVSGGNSVDAGHNSCRRCGWIRDGGRGSVVRGIDLRGSQIAQCLDGGRVRADVSNSTDNIREGRSRISGTAGQRHVSADVRGSGVGDRVSNHREVS